MAGKQSRGENQIVGSGRDERTGCWYVEYEDGTRHVALSPAEGYRLVHDNDEVRLSDSKKLSDVSIKVNVDVSDALKGLKAIQREVRETIKGLKELETYQEVDEHGVARKLSEEIKKLEWRVRGIE